MDQVALPRARGRPREFDHLFEIKLTNAQITALRYRAAMDGTSISAVIRDAVNAHLVAGERRKRRRKRRAA